jgi:hypothetical protein
VSVRGSLHHTVGLGAYPFLGTTQSLELVPTRNISDRKLDKIYTFCVRASVSSAE